MFNIAKDVLESIKQAIVPEFQPVAATGNISFACVGCTGACKQNCTTACKGSCKGGCTRSCKGNSR